MIRFMGGGSHFTDNEGRKSLLIMAFEDVHPTLLLPPIGLIMVDR